MLEQLPQTRSERTYRQDQIFQRDLNLDPLLVAEGRPYEVRLCDCVLVRTKDNLRFLVVDVQTTKEKDETGERGVTRDRLEPVVVKVEQYHLRLSRPLL